VNGAKRSRSGASPPSEAPIPESDVRSVVRLLGETLAFAGDDISRKRFLLTGLARLVGADSWVWVAQKGGASPGDATYFTMIDGGWESVRQKGIATGATWSPDNQPVHDLMGKPVFTLTRSDAFNDTAWYATELFRLYREPAGLDDFMMTGVRIGADIVSLIGLHRKRGKPRFSGRERRLANIVTTEVEWLHRAGIPAAELPNTDELSPRLRHVMLLLLSGNSRKEITSALSISVHTVNEYVAEIYSRLGVHSRAELMARFIQGKRPGV
jgi:DNA-binding CsgD family transcriptional regulator